MSSPSESGKNRPPSDAGSAIGIDLGGTKILGVITDAGTGEVLASHKVLNPRTNAADVVSAFGQLVDRLADGHPELRSIGLGLAGLVDRDGVLRYGPNSPGLLDFAVRDELESMFDVPVAVDNDAAAALRAEIDRGAAQGHGEVVMITQGTGIGGALAVDGQIVRGATGFAGEPGHMMVQRDGHLCACGRRGCWEAYASGAGLVNLWADLRAEGRGLAISERAEREGAAVRGEHVSSAAAAGDPDAIEIFDRFAGWVAQGLGGLVTLLDPQVVVLGGGLAEASEFFLTSVQAQMSRHVLGATHRPDVPVVRATLGETAGAVGASLIGRDRAR